MRYSAEIDEKAFRRAMRRLDNMTAAHRATVQLAATDAAANIVAADARNTTAFEDRTGRLRNSIRASQRDIRVAGFGPATLSVVRAGDESYQATHAGLVHIGHRDRGGGHVRGRRYIHDAVRRNAGRLLPAVRSEMLRALEKLRTRIRRI